MVFIPSSACKACGEEFVKRTELHNHNCRRKLELAVQLGLASKKRLAGQWPDE